MSASSAFKGTVFSRDVALLDKVVEKGQNVQDIAKVQGTQASWLTARTRATGTATIGVLKSIEILDLGIMGVSFDGTTFTYATTAQSGSYVIKARITCTPNGASADTTFEAIFAVPIVATSADITSAVSNQLDKLVLAQLPAVAATDVVPSSGVAFSMEVVIAAVSSANISGVEYDATTVSLSFQKGFVSQAYDSANKSQAITLNWIKADGTINPDIQFTLSTASAAGTDIVELTKFNVGQIRFPATFVDGTTPSLTIPSGAACHVMVDVEAKLFNGSVFVANGVDFALTVGGSDVVFDTAAGLVKSNATDLAIIPPSSAASLFGGALAASSTGVSIVALNVLLQQGFLHPISKTENAGEYCLNVCQSFGAVIGVATNVITVNGFYKGVNFMETLNFLDKNGASVAKVNPGNTIYDNFPAYTSGRVLDFNVDAGFKVPVVENGLWLTKYVRISDLYNDLVNKAASETEVPDLEKRLHALELTLYVTTSSALENPLFADYKTIKEKYVEDVQNL